MQLNCDQESIRFLRLVEKIVPATKAMHVIPGTTTFTSARR
jgi:hypothetical protein